MGARAAAVAADQRGRLMQATLLACAEHGWGPTTVEELVTRAGVSKTTFYEQFANREECFLATFEAVVEAASARIGAAYRSRQGLRERLAAGMLAFAEIVARQAGAAQLVVVDSLGLGAASVPYREAAAQRFETMLRQSYAEALGPGAVGETIGVWVGGVRRVLYRALRDGRPQDMERHVDELVEWAMLYAAAVGDEGGLGTAGAAAAVPVAVPSPVTEELPWEEPPGGEAARAALSGRERIVRATAIVTTERGYAGATVGGICVTAGVSKQTFYVHFEGKQDAFLAAYEALAQQALAVGARAFAAQPEWAGGVAAGLAALLDHIAANRLYARLSFFELPTAGPGALDRADRAMESFTAFLDPAAFGATTPRHPSPVVVEAIGGGLWAAIQHEIAAGRAANLSALAPELTGIVLSPFGLAAPARAAAWVPDNC